VHADPEEFDAAKRAQFPQLQTIQKASAFAVPLMG
jgi:hypothetical protein